MDHAVKSSHQNGKTVTKRALLVGCNYPNTESELHGCVNDVTNWRRLLIEELGFEPWNIRILVDVGNKTESPTGFNIKCELARLVAESRAGDIVFFQFSGHGTQVRADYWGDYEEDGLDEAIVPTDLNLIFDDDLRDILSGLDPGGTRILEDCCHSGGLLDHEEVVISGGAEMKSEHEGNAGENGSANDTLVRGMSAVRAPQAKKGRALDMQAVANMLKGAAPQHAATVDQNGIRAALYDIYGQDASNVVLAAKKEDLPAERAQRICYVAPGKKPSNGLIDPNKGILITGCQSHETSMDMGGADGNAFGLLSYVLTAVVRWYIQHQESKPVSNYDAVLETRYIINYYGFDQNPCLESSVENAFSNFVLW